MIFRKRFFYLLVCTLFLVTLMFSCKKEKPKDNPLSNLDGMPFANLSDYNFFMGEMKNQQPNEKIVPYDLNTPLFTDYAGKARFVYVPEGKQAVYNSSTYLDFPVGSILIKTFYFNTDFRNPSLGRKIYETRLLVHKANGWEAYTYLWDDAQAEAKNYVAGKNVNISWIHFDGNTRSTLYHIPNKNECKGCHNEAEKIIPLGPKARNLNKDYAYSGGTMNQLEKWKALGILSGFSQASTAPKVAVWNDPATGSISERARAYLDVNCAHCHNTQGPANNSGLLLDYYQTNLTALGICKTPIAAGPGSGGRLYDIVPGQPQNSIMIYRLNSTVPDVSMPELGRSAIHEEGVQLLIDWINLLPPAGCE